LTSVIVVPISVQKIKDQVCQWSMAFKNGTSREQGLCDSNVKVNF